MELKAQSVVVSFPVYPITSTDENLFEAHPTLSDTTESPLSTPPSVETHQVLDETSSFTEMSYDSQYPTTMQNRSISTTDTYDSTQNTSLLLRVDNETVHHQTLNFTFYDSVPESTTRYPESSYEPNTQTQTGADRNPEEKIQSSEGPKDLQEIQEASLNFSRTQANYSETDSSHTQEKSSSEVTSDPMVQGKLEEAAAEVSVQIFLSQASKKEDDVITQGAQTTKSSIEDQTSSWAPLDGSGDISQGTSCIVLNC